MHRCPRDKEGLLLPYGIRHHLYDTPSLFEMSRLNLLIIVEARRVIEPRIRVMMLKITHMIDVTRTKRNFGIIMHNKDTGSHSLVGTGRTLTGRPASGLAGQLAHALVAALGASTASLTSGNT